MLQLPVVGAPEKTRFMSGTSVGGRDDRDGSDVFLMTASLPHRSATIPHNNDITILRMRQEDISKNNTRQTIF